MTGPDDAGLAARLRAAGCVFAEEEAQVLMSAAAGPRELASMVERRVAGEPLEQVVGWAEFCGLRIAVEPGVFVPRRRTEFLVERAVALAGQAAGHPGRDGAAGRIVALDMCCGSGAVGAALASMLAGVEVHAADIDPAAVRCARRNLAAAGGRVYTGDLYQPLPGTLRGRVTILTANVPYVPTPQTALLPAEARVHEPARAYDGGADGLDVLRRVAAGAPGWLAPGGSVVMETTQRQQGKALAILAGHGLTASAAHSAELETTVVMGTMPPAAGAAGSHHPA